MRERNTQVFFDNNLDETDTVMVVFNDDRHGLVLDVLSILTDLDVQCTKFASSESDAMKVVLPRLEGELLSVRDLGLAIDNCNAWHITDSDGDKIYDPDRLEQIATCVRLELNSGAGRPSQAGLTWHRAVVNKIRSDEQLSSIAMQTLDHANLLRSMTRFLDIEAKLDVVNALIKTISARVEDVFYVRNAESKSQLASDQIEGVTAGLLKAAVGNCDEWRTRRGRGAQVWYQYREFGDLCVLEAVEADPAFMSKYPGWRTAETPSLRGRLGDSPYKPLEVE
mmetsp:Transcript_29634/g.72057  ORF Transcript_29634/g.72057 Transcript_29634/m.72057 type:complete len:281 (+) Transcript_29634:1-843(+)